ncbi:MAG: alpha/beta fold hydrolase [Oleiphilaceae bacterium]|nr:alpha/beta fold hydrolase [Oleiphilaceae bacterium]
MGSDSQPLPVVLISGWGLPVSWISPVLPQRGGSVAAQDRAWSLSDFTSRSPGAWLEQALEQAPPKAIWVGWSLGGQLAMAAADRAPERVAAVVTLCSTPCFVAGEDWPHGRPGEEFDAFAGRCEKDPAGTLRRFALLQSRGDAHEARARREGPAAVKEAQRHDPIDGQVLGETLQWLRRNDQRRLWRRPMAQPRLHLFGERDSLVAPATPVALGLDPQQWQPLPGLAHWPFGPHLPALQALLQERFQRWSALHDKPDAV